MCKSRLQEHQWNTICKLVCLQAYSRSLLFVPFDGPYIISDTYCYIFILHRFRNIYHLFPKNRHVMTWTRLFQWWFVAWELRLYGQPLHQFEVPTFTYYENTKCNAKCRNRGWFMVVTCDRQTDGWTEVRTTTAYTALTWRRAVKPWRREVRTKCRCVYCMQLFTLFKLQKYYIVWRYREPFSSDHNVSPGCL